MTCQEWPSGVIPPARYHVRTLSTRYAADDIWFRSQRQGRCTLQQFHTYPRTLSRMCSGVISEDLADERRLFPRRRGVFQYVLL